MAKRILRASATEKLTGLGPSQRRRLIRAGIFPQPIKLGPRSVGWIEDELLQWIDDQAAARESSEAPQAA